MASSDREYAAGATLSWLRGLAGSMAPFLVVFVVSVITLVILIC